MSGNYVIRRSAPFTPLSLSALRFTSIESYLKLNGKEKSRDKDLSSDLGVELDTFRKLPRAAELGLLYNQKRETAPLRS